MKVIHNKFFPFGSYRTINLFGVLFTKNNKLSKRTINHESIHTAQMKELLYIPFYIWYAIEYLFTRFSNSTQNKAYRDISFEEEAYNNEGKPYYLKIRKPYSWFKYLKLRSNGK